MSSFRYENSTQQTLISTELNSLANNGRAPATTAFDNSAVGAGWLWGDLELNVTYGVAPTVNTTVDLYFLISTDGSTYTDGDSSTDPPLTVFVGSFPLRAVTTAQKVTVRGIPMPPGKFKPFLKNNGTGQAMAASGNTLVALLYRQQTA